jgi:hypothetical protein
MDEPTDLDKFTALVLRDKTVTIMFAIAMFLIVFNVVAIGVLARRGLGHAGLFEVSLALTAAFAIAGVALGLVRSIRSGRRAKNRTA